MSVVWHDLFKKKEQASAAKNSDDVEAKASLNFLTKHAPNPLDNLTDPLEDAVTKQTRVGSLSVTTLWHALHGWQVPPLPVGSGSTHLGRKAKQPSTLTRSCKNF